MLRQFELNIAEKSTTADNFQKVDSDFFTNFILKSSVKSLLTTVSIRNGYQKIHSYFNTEKIPANIDTKIHTLKLDLL